MNNDTPAVDSNLIETLMYSTLRSFGRQQRYAVSLVEDLTPDEMVSQPIREIVMNHPAWVLSHLNVYMPVLMAMLSGVAPEDPLDHEFGQRSKPLPGVNDYPPKDKLVALYVSLHKETAEIFRLVDPEILTLATPIPRFLDRFPKIADVAIQLMVKHEATHLGQLSAWRRAGGRPMVTP